MKFMKLDTPAQSASASAPSPAHKHNDAADHGGYVYLDEMLDKTFLTDYFIH